MNERWVQRYDCLSEFPLQICTFLILRTSEIHSFYNLLLFYWHFLEILWMFIFLILYFYILGISCNNKFIIEFSFFFLKFIDFSVAEFKGVEGQSRFHLLFFDYRRLCWNIDAWACVHHQAFKTRFIFNLIEFLWNRETTVNEPIIGGLS